MEHIFQAIDQIPIIIIADPEQETYSEIVITQETVNHLKTIGRWYEPEHHFDYAVLLDHVGKKLPEQFLLYKLFIGDEEVPKTQVLKLRSNKVTDDTLVIYARADDYCNSIELNVDHNTYNNYELVCEIQSIELKVKTYSLICNNE